MKNVLTILVAMSAEGNSNIITPIKLMSKRMFDFIKHRLAGTEDTEEFQQDFFYWFIVSAEPIELASSWLYTIAGNKFTDSYRQYKLPVAADLLSGVETDDLIIDWKKIHLPSNTTPDTT